MSLYSHQEILFLPKPPRSAFSIGPEWSRCRLPDLEDVAQLHTFLRRLFVYDLSYVPALQPQIKFSAIFLAVVMLVVIFIIARRMYEQSFWLIRIVERPSGNIMVPNSIICFAIVEGVFCAVFMTFMWVFVATLYAQTIPPILNPAWMLMTWCPLISGKFWAAWGMYFATPSHLGSRKSWHRAGVDGGWVAFVRSAKMTNCFGIAFPFILSLTIAIPTCVAMKQWTVAYQSLKTWEKTYLSSEDFTQAMVQDAQTVWYKMTETMFTVTVAYIIWAFWSMTVFVMYCWSSFRLLSVIRREMRVMKDDVGARQGIAVVTRCDPALPPSLHVEQRQADEPMVLYEIMESAAVAAATNGQARTNADLSFSTTLAGTSEAKSASSIKNTPWPHTDRLNGMSSKRSQRRTKPHVIVGKNELRVNQGVRHTRRDQVNQLNKAVFHVCLQVAAIGPATVVFFFIALLLAISVFPSTEQPFRGGTYLGPVIALAISVVIWIVVFFGGTTFFAILFRTYECMLANVYFSAQTYATGLREHRRVLSAEQASKSTNSITNPALVRLKIRGSGDALRRENAQTKDMTLDVPLKIYMQRATVSASSSYSLPLVEPERSQSSAQLISGSTNVEEDEDKGKRVTMCDFLVQDDIGRNANAVAQPKTHKRTRDGSFSSYWAANRSD